MREIGHHGVCLEMESGKSALFYSVTMMPGHYILITYVETRFD